MRYPRYRACSWPACENLQVPPSSLIVVNILSGTLLLAYSPYGWQWTVAIAVLEDEDINESISTPENGEWEGIIEVRQRQSDS